jgi:molecular chaperone GrpE (heat shock protein)|tara:strand:- start:46 stop:351 length:306 start_codon:yes stop_codon:yes gene_type:complete
VCVWVDNELNFAYHVGNSTTELSVQGDNMSNLKNKLFNDKYLEELNKVHQELEEQETEINNDIVNADNLTELDDIDIQKFCNEQEAYESLDSLDSFNYMEI